MNQQCRMESLADSSNPPYQALTFVNSATRGGEN